MQLAPGQHGLEQIACIHAAFGFASAHNGVQLIDEQDDLAFRFADLFQHRLEPLFKFAPVFGTGNQGAHIQGKDRPVLQTLRHISPDDSLGQSFGNGRLAHARLANEHRIVLGFPGQNPHHIADFGIPADHRIQLLAAGPLHQIGAVFLQSVIGVLRVVGIHRAAFYFGQLLGEPIFRHAPGREHLPQRSRAFVQQGQHQMFHRHIAVAHFLCDLLGEIQGLADFRCSIHLGIAAGDLGQIADHGVQLSHKAILIHTHLPQKRTDKPAVLIHQSIQQMLRHHILILIFLGHLLGCADGVQCFLCIAIGIHCSSPRF